VAVARINNEHGLGTKLNIIRLWVKDVLVNFVANENEYLRVSTLKENPVLLLPFS